MEKLPFFIHGQPITDQAAASNVGAEHRLLLVDVDRLRVDYLRITIVSD